ncbi:hypothetical protein I3843_16G106700 [Carya illinoinensis]|nr:hypothetical protein I3843_16G106700 [Carya illinoinensis]
MGSLSLSLSLSLSYCVPLSTKNYDASSLVEQDGERFKSVEGSLQLSIIV